MTDFIDLSLNSNDVRLKTVDNGDGTESLAVGIQNATLTVGDIGLTGSTYLGGQTIVPAGESAAATIPANTTSIQLSAEGGVAYYLINGTPASATSPGFIPQNQANYILNVANLTSLTVFAAVGVSIHVQYYQD